MSFSLEMLLALLAFLLIVFLILYLDKKTYFTNKDLLDKDIQRKIENEVTKRLSNEVEKQLKEKIKEIDQAAKKDCEIKPSVSSEPSSNSPAEQNDASRTGAPIGNMSYPTDKKRDIYVYVPSMKIWGIGLIVGLVIFISPILYKIIESLFIKHPEYRTDLCLRWPVWPYVVQIFGLLFIFGIFALVITAIIRIAKED